MRNKQAFRLAVTTVRHGRAGLLRTTALQAAALLVFVVPAVQPAIAQPAPGARPGGGVVVGGGASIGQTAAVTTVTQSTQRAAIDWRSFDVGAAHTVQFQQPGASAIVLNRVVGPNPSQIAGRIQANGQVVITNQSGVVFHQGAQIEAASLIVSAAGIATPNFMAGRMVFDQAPTPGAAVTNAGTITVKETGLAALVAPRVANSGVINARMGRAVLAGAETHTIDLYGDGLLSIDVTSQVRQAPHGPDGKPVTALVTNTGTIMADGGSVTLTAAAADGIVQTLVQAGGKLQANAAGGRAGTIVVAGVGGSVRIEGRVVAEGGTVLASATDAVTVAAAAHVNASGRDGGGVIGIGTRAAKSVTVEAGARIAANARYAGNGGRVTIISGGSTAMNGAVAALGGPSGGNGGAVELSGKTLGFAGRVDTSAPAGRLGQVLIDPADVTISDHGGPGTVVTPASLEATDGNVIVQADNSVVAASSVKLGGTFQTLTLTAGNFVRIDPGVTLTAGGVNLNAGAGGVSILGNITTAPKQLPLSFKVTGPVTQGAASAIIADEINGTVGSAALTSRLNRIAGIGSPFSDGLKATTGDISIVTAVPLALHGAYAAFGTVVPDGHTISFTADTLTLARGLFQAPAAGVAASALNGAIDIQAFTPNLPIEVTTGAGTAKTLSIAAGSLGLLATPTLSLGSATGGAITLAPNGAAIDFGTTGITTLTLRSAGNIGQVGTVAVTNVDAAGLNVDLSAAGNFMPNITRLVAANNALLHTGGTLNVNGPVTGPTAVSLSSTGAGETPGMTLNADIRGGAVRLDAFNGETLASSGAIQQNAGTINAASLAGQAGSASFGKANAVTVGNFHTARDFAFNGGTAIVLDGTLQSDAGAVRLTTPGAVTQGANGVLITPTLTGTAGSAAILGVANQVGTLQNFTATTGGLALVTTLAVVPPGPSVPGGSTPLLLVGANTAPAGQTISITADRVAFATGASVPGGAGSLAAPAGTVAFAPLSAGRAVELVATAAEQSANALSLTQANANAIITGTLQLGNAATGPITIDGPFNLSNTGTLRLVSAGAISETPAGALTVNTLAASGASLALGGANRITTLGALSTTGDLTIVNAQGLSAAGPVLSGTKVRLDSAGDLALLGAITAPTVTLNATGSITQPSGAIVAKTLNVAATGDATLSGAVDALGTVQVPGAFNFKDTAPGLVVGGPVNVGTFNLAAGALDVAGALTAGTLQLDVASAGQSGGALQVGVLRGLGGSGIAFGSTNGIGSGTASIAAIETLAASSLTVNDSVPLIVRGTLRAAQLALSAAGSLTLQGGAIGADFAAFEVRAPGAPVPQGALAAGNNAPGVLSQTGTTTIAPLTRPAAQVSMTVHGGLIAFENLVAPSANLTLAMNAGRASGSLNAAALNVADQGGSASLLGTVAGRTGFDAATIATITTFDRAYTLNGCAIASISCVPIVVPPVVVPPVVVLPVVVPPVVVPPVVRLVLPSTLRPDIVLMESLLRPDLFTADLVTLDILRSPADPDFALPNIADRDY